MKWTDEMDIILLKEIVLFEPWNFKRGSEERGRCWEQLAESLSAQNTYRKLSQRSVRDRYKLLC